MHVFESKGAIIGWVYVRFRALVSGYWFLVAGFLSLVAAQEMAHGLRLKANGRNMGHHHLTLRHTPCAFCLLPYTLYRFPSCQPPEAIDQRPLTRGQYPASSIEHPASNFFFQNLKRLAGGLLFGGLFVFPGSLGC
jgi:hypothetical protein